jgi:hypothetical protein
MNLYPVITELNNAKEALENYKKSKDQFEENKHWCSLVDYLGKSFNKLESISKTASPKFRNLIGLAINERKKNPLLQYVKQARDAYQHSVQELTNLEIISNIPTGEKFTLTKMDKDSEGNLVPGEANEYDMFPAAHMLQPVSNYGKIYLPPVYHKGILLKHRDPLQVGILAIEHYENLYEKLALVEN